jgi:hypothetical protein
LQSFYGTFGSRRVIDSEKRKNEKGDSLWEVKYEGNVYVGSGERVKRQQQLFNPFILLRHFLRLLIRIDCDFTVIDHGCTRKRELKKNSRALSTKHWQSYTRIDIA